MLLKYFPLTGWITEKVWMRWTFWISNYNTPPETTFELHSQPLCQNSGMSLNKHSDFLSNPTRKRKQFEEHHVWGICIVKRYLYRKELDPKLVVICGVQSPEGGLSSILSLYLFYPTQVAHIESGQALSAILADLKWPSCVGSVG